MITVDVPSCLKVISPVIDFSDRAVLINYSNRGSNV